MDFARLLRPLSAVRRRLWLYRHDRKLGTKRFAAFGEGSLIEPPALVIGQENIRIGRDVRIHGRCFISVVEEDLGRRYGGQLVIADRVTIGFDLVIACAARIEIGEDCAIAHRVFIGDTNHDYRDVNRTPLGQGLAEPEPIRIGDRCFLGTGCAIMPGVTIGDGAAVGANAVVTQDVPPNTLVGGIPARPIRRWNGTEWIDVQSEEAQV